MSRASCRSQSTPAVSRRSLQLASPSGDHLHSADLFLVARGTACRDSAALNAAASLVPLLLPPLVLPVLLGHARLLVGLEVADQQRLAHQHPAFRWGVAGRLPVVQRQPCRSMVTNSCRAWARSSALSS